MTATTHDATAGHDPSLDLALVCLDAARGGATVRHTTFTLVVVGRTGQPLLSASTGPDRTEQALSAARIALQRGGIVESTEAAGAPLPTLTALGGRVRGAVGVVTTEEHATTPLLDIDRSLGRYVRNALQDARPA